MPGWELHRLVVLKLSLQRADEFEEGIGQSPYFCIAAFAIIISTLSTLLPNRGSNFFYSCPSASFCRLCLASLKNYLTILVNIWGAKNRSIVKTLCAYSTLPSIESIAGWGGPWSVGKEASLHLPVNKPRHRSLEHQPLHCSSQQTQRTFMKMGLLNDY